MKHVKFIQIVMAPEGIFALTNTGMIFYGWFIAQGPHTKPKFQWRLVPHPVISDVHVYETAVEPTPAQLDVMREEFMKREVETK